MLALNDRHRIPVVVGATVLLLMGLFPPWVTTWASSPFGRTVPLGYCLIFSPPEMPEGYSIQIDGWRLMLQWVLVAVAVATWIAWKTKRQEPTADVHSPLSRIPPPPPVVIERHYHLSEPVVERRGEILATVLPVRKIHEIESAGTAVNDGADAERDCSRAALLQRAESFLRQGHLGKAIDQYQKVIQQQPRDWSTINAAGDLLVRSGQLERGIEHFTLIADHFYDQEFLPRAAAVYKKILTLKPSDVHARVRSADISRRQNPHADDCGAR